MERERKRRGGSGGEREGKEEEEGRANEEKEVGGREGEGGRRMVGEWGRGGRGWEGG